MSSLMIVSHVYKEGEVTKKVGTVVAKVGVTSNRVVVEGQLIGHVINLADCIMKKGGQEHGS